MRTHLFIASAISLALLTSAAFASSPGPGSGVPGGERRAGSHYTTQTNDDELMCKSLGTQFHQEADSVAKDKWSQGAMALHDQGASACRNGEFASGLDKQEQAVRQAGAVPVAVPAD
jgi:hypothetical protein